jgi:predicted nucleic acid-binding Zn ribbon protein
VTRRPAPRPAAPAFRAALRRAAPRTRLATVQAAWRDAVGEQLSAAARPVAERSGTVVVACVDSVWAQELDLMHDRLLAQLSERLGDDAPSALRFRVEDAED